MGMATFRYGPTVLPKTAGLIYKVERPDGAVIERIWTANAPYNAFGSGLMNAYMRTEFTSIKDALGGLTKTAIRDFKCDKNGNVTHR